MINKQTFSIPPRYLLSTHPRYVIFLQLVFFKVRNNVSASYHHQYHHKHYSHYHSLPLLLPPHSPLASPVLPYDAPTPPERRTPSVVRCRVFTVYRIHRSPLMQAEMQQKSHYFYSCLYLVRSSHLWGCSFSE